MLGPFGDAGGTNRGQGRCGIGVRQFIARQVVVGNKHFNTGFFRQCHTFNGRNTVINGNDKLGSLRYCQLSHWRRQAVAVLETDWYQIFYILKAQRFQAG